MCNNSSLDKVQLAKIKDVTIFPFTLELVTIPH